MTDREIYNDALKRYRKTHTDELLTAFDVIVFLARECEESREKIKCMKAYIDGMNTAREPAQEFTTEQASDGGVMTLSTKTATWRLVHECLLSNGYFVCCHFNEDETITIEYFRA